MHKTVILSDGEACEVRALGIFELDRVAPDQLPGPYYYEYTAVTGEVVRDIYDPFAVKNPPEKPEVPKSECVEKSVGWEQWAEYETYHAALAHHQNNIALLERYAGDAARYILEHCINDEDRSRIATDADWELVHNAAFIPQLTEEDIADTLRRSFQGTV